jgi:HAD superfamily hydrolase (TIGR01509 family)
MNYIFDFDGTLVDSMPYWAGAHIKALEDAGIPIPDGFVNTITPLGNLGASKYTISLGLSASLDEYLSSLNERLYREYTTRVPLKSHVHETLLKLKACGHRLFVLTASPHFYLDDCLKGLGIYDLFDAVYSIDDFGMVKSDTAIYVATANRIGASVSDCVFVDDNEIAVATSKAAGMYAVGVYDESSKDRQNSIAAIADAYAVTFAELPIF